MEAQSKMRTCTTLFKSFFCFCFWRALKRTKKKATAFESMPGSPVSQERLGYSGSPQILHLSKMRWKRPHIGPALQGIWAVELPSACHLWGGIDPHQLFPLWVLQLGPALCVGSSFRHSNRFYGWFSGCSITEPWTSKCWLVSLSLCRLGSLLEARFMPGKIQNDLFCTWPHFNWGLVEAYILEGLNTAVLNSLTLSACFNGTHTCFAPPPTPFSCYLSSADRGCFFLKAKVYFCPQSVRLDSKWHTGACQSLFIIIKDSALPHPSHFALHCIFIIENCSLMILINARPLLRSQEANPIPLAWWENVLWRKKLFLNYFAISPISNARNVEM